MDNEAPAPPPPLAAEMEQEDKQPTPIHSPLSVAGLIDVLNSTTAALLEIVKDPTARRFLGSHASNLNRIAQEVETIGLAGHAASRDPAADSFSWASLSADVATLTGDRRRAATRRATARADDSAGAGADADGSHHRYTRNDNDGSDDGDGADDDDDDGDGDDVNGSGFGYDDNDVADDDGQQQSSPLPSTSSFSGKMVRRNGRLIMCWTNQEVAFLRRAAAEVGPYAVAIHKRHGPRGTISRNLGRFTQEQINNKIVTESRAGRPLPRGPPGGAVAAAASSRAGSPHASRESLAPTPTRQLRTAAASASGNDGSAPSTEYGADESKPQDADGNDRGAESDQGSQTSAAPSDGGRITRQRQASTDSTAAKEAQNGHHHLTTAPGGGGNDDDDSRQGRTRPSSSASNHGDTAAANANANKKFWSDMEMDALRKAANRFGKSAALIYRHHGPRGIDDQALGRFEQWQIANKLTGETRVGRMMGQQTRRYRHANAKSRAVVSDDESDDDSDESDDSEDEGSSDGDQAGRSDTTKPAASSAAADRRRRNSSSSTTSTSAGPPFATITLGSGRRSQPAAAAAAAAHEAPGTGRYSSRAYTPLQPEYTPSLKDRPGRWTALENLALRRAAVFCGLNVELILARYGEQGTVNRSLGRFNATQVTARFVNEKRSGRPIHSAESPRVTSPSDPEPELTAADVDTYGLRAALTQVATPMSSPIVGAPQQWQIPPPAPPLSSSLPASPSLRPPAAAPRAAAAATPSMSSLTTSGPFPKSEPSARMGPPSSSSLHASPLITSPSSGDRHRRMSPPTTTIASATLSPNVYGAANHNKLKWTEEVHQLLYKLVLHYGPRWDVIYERHGHELPNVSNTFSIAAVVYRAASRKVAPQPIIDMTIKGRGFWATSTKSNPPPLLYYSMDALNEPYIPSEEPAAAAAPAMDASPGDANRKRKISELSELPPDEGEEEEEEDEAGGSPTKIPRLS